jgi:NADH:ubiquinone reductase (H+-translocating)
MSAVPLHRQAEKAEPDTSVVIVGSGFAAFECARGLVRRLDTAGASDATVTIVSPADYMEHQ